MKENHDLNASLDRTRDEFSTEAAETDNQVPTCKLVDAWLAHGDKPWRALYATPLPAAIMFTGGYTLSTTGEVIFSRLFLVVACAVAIIQFPAVSRMAQYDAAFFGAVRDRLAPVPEPGFGASDRQIAQAVPGVLLALFSGRLIVDLWSSASPVDHEITEVHVVL